MKLAYYLNYLASKPLEMKKLLVTALCLCIFVKGRSQVYLQGGLNLANITEDAAGQTEKNNILTTFNAGILGRMNISEIVDLETGLLFTGKGAKAKSFFGTTTDDNYAIAKFNPFYLEIPLNLVLKFPVLSKSNVFVYGGPYASVGITGKSTTQSKIIGVTSSSESDITFSNDNPFTPGQEDASFSKLKRFDFGLNAGAGLDLVKMIVKVNYGYGLTKINSTQSDNNADNKNKYRTISFSLGIPLKR